MTVYARTDVVAVTHPVSGKTFKRKSKDVFAIDADPEFEASLLETYPDQFASVADEVPPTPDEIASLPEHARQAAIVARERAAQSAGVLAETRGRANRAIGRSE